MIWNTDDAYQCRVWWQHPMSQLLKTLKALPESANQMYVVVAWGGSKEVNLECMSPGHVGMRLGGELLRPNGTTQNWVPLVTTLLACGILWCMWVVVV